MDSNKREAVGESVGTIENTPTRKTLCEYLVDAGKLDHGNIERAYRLQLEQEQ